MKIGYARVSTHDQQTDLQLDALVEHGVKVEDIYQDVASGKKDDRPASLACLKALREGDTLVVWKLDRLGRDLRHLINTVHDLTARGIGLKVLAGHGASIDTTTASGKLVFGIFASLAEFERELIRERTMAGLASARARGRTGGRKFAMTPSMLRRAQHGMANRDTNVGDLCVELGIFIETRMCHDPTPENPETQSRPSSGLVLLLLWDADLDQFVIRYHLTRPSALALKCTAEHLTAQCEGGKDRADNIVAACLICNRRRHQTTKPKSPSDYQRHVQARVRKGKWHPQGWIKAVFNTGSEWQENRP